MELMTQRGFRGEIATIQLVGVVWIRDDIRQDKSRQFSSGIIGGGSADDGRLHDWCGRVELLHQRLVNERDCWCEPNLVLWTLLIPVYLACSLLSQLLFRGNVAGSSRSAWDFALKRPVLKLKPGPMISKCVHTKQNTIASYQKEKR